MKMAEKEYERSLTQELRDVCAELVYHGRFFATARDEVVLRKTVEYLQRIIRREIKNAQSRTK